MINVKFKTRLLLLVFTASLIACSGESSAPQSSEGQNNDFANVFTLVEIPSGIKEAERLGQWFPASDFEALGIYLPPGQAIEIGGHCSLGRVA